MAIRIHQGLRNIGKSEIFSFHLPDKSVEEHVSSLDSIGLGRRDDILIYHLSYGDPVLTKFLMGRSEKLILVYHNITPSGYFVGVAPKFATGLEWGRHELALMADRAVLSVADSEFNAAELREAGHRNVAVLPAGVDPTRLVSECLDVRLVREIESDMPNGFVLFVSQLLPHKRPDIALEAVHLLRSKMKRDVGLVMAGPMRMTDFAVTVQRFADSLPAMTVRFMGEVDDPQLATLYRTCLCYFNPSDHEGFAVPPLEAMACGAPVVVRNCGAMGSTVGHGGLVLPSEWGPSLIARALDEIIGDEDARAAMRANGYKRAAQFDPEQSVADFVDLVKPLL
jgi:glycosyltransferase involved in cell wall biosynthesis